MGKRKILATVIAVILIWTTLTCVNSYNFKDLAKECDGVWISCRKASVYPANNEILFDEGYREEE